MMSDEQFTHGLVDIMSQHSFVIAPMHQQNTEKLILELIRSRDIERDKKRDEEKMQESTEWLVDGIAKYYWERQNNMSEWEKPTFKVLKDHYRDEARTAIRAAIKLREKRD